MGFDFGPTAPETAVRYIARPRVDLALAQAARSPLVYVIAGAGYGKTQAVRSFVLQQEDAGVYWVRLTESDNIGTHFWENLTHVMAGSPALAAKMRDFGFPETAARFKQFFAAAVPSARGRRRAFVVLDDFHAVHNPQLLLFVERFAHLSISGVCTILISRTEPEINAVAPLAKGEVSVVAEDVLRFTPEEIAAFLAQRGISVAPGSLPRIYKETHGWALAVELLSMALRHMPQERAVATMKQNIFRLMEREAFADFPEAIQKDMARLALVAHLPFTPLRDFEDASFFRTNPQIASFIWFDSLIGDYRVHPLFAEFLQGKLHLLTQEEKREIYHWAARWCAQNDYHMDAMAYYAKLRDYGGMMGIYLSYANKLPRDTAEYYLRILEDLAPLCEALDYPLKSYEESALQMLVKVFIPWLLMELGRYEESQEKILTAIAQWEEALARHEDAYLATLLFSNYNNLGYLRMYTCVDTHRYDFPQCFRISMKYFGASPHTPEVNPGPFTCADVHSFACLVGVTARRENFDEFIGAMQEAVRYIPAAMDGLYGGYDELAAAELSYFRNRPGEARRHARRAMATARANRQYGIEAMSAQYLLRVSLQEGDYALAAEMLRALEDLLGTPDFWDRRPLCDVFTGFFYAQLGLPELAAPWLTMDVQDELGGSHAPERELLVRARCLIASQKYNEALATLCQLAPGDGQSGRLLLVELTLYLLRAAARMKTGDPEGALADLERAYQLSFSGEFETPFIELGRHMQGLAALAARQEGCAIPMAWLESIGRKAGIYIKKTAFLVNAYRKANNIEEPISITERERQVLSDLYHGLSRAEIAANRYLSINTVKTILQTLYLKLGAENNVDAVRIALEKNLL